MEKYYYLVFTPESFIASHLAPEDFGHYLSVGTRKRIHCQNIFFELDPERMDNIPHGYIDSKLIAYPDGSPKSSVFFGIYRVLEKTPLEALKKLYLATDDGKVLGLDPAAYPPGEPDAIHLYQQFNPVTTRVASKMRPDEFVAFLTDQSKPVSTPKLFFAEMQLNELATDPNAPLSNLPYPNPDHLRECLRKLNETSERVTKTVLRFMRGDLIYRTIKNGFYIGENNRMIYYPFPTIQALESKFFYWWRSALIQHY